MVQNYCFFFLFCYFFILLSDFSQHFFFQRFAFSIYIRFKAIIFSTFELIPYQFLHITLVWNVQSLFLLNYAYNMCCHNQCVSVEINYGWNLAENCYLCCFLFFRFSRHSHSSSFCVWFFALFFSSSFFLQKKLSSGDKRQAFFFKFVILKCCEQS